jgi:hypothetical protein
MARSRAFSGTASVRSSWADNGHGAVRNASTGGHTGPFDAELARKLHLGHWARRHGLAGDDGAPVALLERLVADRKRVQGPDPLSTLSARTTLPTGAEPQGALTERSPSWSRWWRTCNAYRTRALHDSRGSSRRGPAARRSGKPAGRNHRGIRRRSIRSTISPYGAVRRVTKSEQCGCWNPWCQPCSRR